MKLARLPSTTDSGLDMCGIAGIFHYDTPGRPVDRALLERMTRALAHRGPDGEGFHIDGPLGFGHRRLAIVDLSAMGNQPMSNEDGSLWINYNGEFYNHQDFRTGLLARHAFRGTSDTETLLHLFEERGAECLPQVAGIFAVAFWERNGRRLTLARDPLGVKQLYYHDDGRRLVFASEIKALLLCEDIQRELDPEGLNQYLHFHTPVFERTFFKDIRQLRAGEYLEASETGVRRRTYWRVSDFSSRGGSPEDNVAALQSEVRWIVSEQLMSDVPVGSFFSGGIDSTAAAAYAKRAGRPPQCFGVHFSNQGVIDERPYQEAAATALGLELDLITLDGSSFPDDLMRLMYQQDQPVIGPAMFPMYYVSKLAAQKVKVCLGGQAADEIFGGYARYALARPLDVIASWFKGRYLKAEGGAATTVGGNLFSQLADPRTLRRLGQNVAHLADWRARYFENFAKVPESAWRRLFAEDELVSRANCRAIFDDVVNRSEAADPATKAMHWDVQTYLTGLFQQDDRMSMAHGLESRVPLADPRLVQFAFRIDFDLKFRSGASKWILRKAVADAVPSEVLNRRKVGFDTPVERWIRGPHAGFVRDLLLSSRARQRGIWNARSLQTLIDNTGGPIWFDTVWKALCVEAWARSFLDADSASRQRQDEVIVNQFGRKAHEPLSDRLERCTDEPLSNGLASGSEESSRPAQPIPRLRQAASAVRNAVQEVRELGVSGTVFRAQWELKLRSGLTQHLEVEPPPVSEETVRVSAEHALRPMPFDSVQVAAVIRERTPHENISTLVECARQAQRGRILCFGRWTADFGQPIDWHLNPATGRRWNPMLHWSRALEDSRRVGDVKLTWEVARFPHAYHLARAAVFAPQHRRDFAEGLARQIESFVVANPYGYGIHWSSGQEIAIRLVAWLFALSAFGDEPAIRKVVPSAVRWIYQSLVHIERNLSYTLRSVYNNHLIAEALALFVGGSVFPELPDADRRRQQGMSILSEQADAQFYSDGAYILHSHNYHRAALGYYLLACGALKQRGDAVPAQWQGALERSLDFLLAHQEPAEGRLPNFGANDGSLPSVLSTCDFSDFRPVLQATSVLTRGERIYEPGPWDEAVAWLLGPKSLETPLRKPKLRSVSFAKSGYHVLRGSDASSFGAFRCGTVTERFTQIDMLSLDVWWRGQNVLVDAGSYLYNGAERWHRHFARTDSHNTVQLDGVDQMVHHRRFKNLFWTQAKLLRFEDRGDWVICEGEHYGYQKNGKDTVHRRAILFVKDDLWIVVDHLFGRGNHCVRLHWLGGDLEHDYAASDGRLTLTTREGPFCIAVVDVRGHPLGGAVTRGEYETPSGWLSRYYGDKVAVPSLSIERRTEIPYTLVSILSAGEARIGVQAGTWSVLAAGAEVTFGLEGGQFTQVSVARIERKRLASR